jgi:hypothetical protein
MNVLHISLKDLMDATTGVMCLLSYGMVVDTIDEYLKLGKPIVLQYLEKISEDIIDCYMAVTPEFLKI